MIGLRYLPLIAGLLALAAGGRAQEPFLDSELYRQSLDRRVEHRPEDAIFVSETTGRLAVSIYSLPSAFFSPEEIDRFLNAVRSLDAERRILVLSDYAPTRIGARARVDILSTDGRPYSPWPRDPFSIVATQAGGVRLLLRPSLQEGREADATLGLEIVQQLPPDLDKAWLGATWAVAPVPFHNGQVLMGREAWISLHSVEPRVLSILGVESVPVQSFQTRDGVLRYLSAARRAAGELEDLYRRPVRFVHPMEVGSEPLSQMLRLEGGAGFDLDSLATLLPEVEGRARFLVADLSLGKQLLKRIPESEWAAFGPAMGLSLATAALPGTLSKVLESDRARRLEVFLDLMCEHLAGTGSTVRRLPLLLIPTRYLGEAHSLPEFLVTWNNVVIEESSGAYRAEGFSSLLPTADREAQEIFARAGVRLDLLPPLVRSVVLNGGYRCASNHWRRR